LDKGENNMQEQKTVGQSIASLVLGILSLLMFGLITGIPAVICGHIAKSKIKADPENLKGDGQALAGLILGYISIGVSILMAIAIMAAVAIPLLSGSMSCAAATEGQAGCSTIYTAERIHMAEHGTYIDAGTPEMLPGIDDGELQGRYFDHNSYSVNVAGESTLIISATANGTDDIIGDVIMTISEGSMPEWSGSLIE
jgi:hypothetical protein